jgi:hypothetical protein
MDDQPQVSQQEADIYKHQLTEALLEAVTRVLPNFPPPHQDAGLSISAFMTAMNDIQMRICMYAGVPIESIADFYEMVVESIKRDPRYGQSTPLVMRPPTEPDH